MPEPIIYNALRPLLQRVLARFGARGQGPREAAVYLVTRCGPSLRPHLLRFYSELAALPDAVSDDAAFPRHGGASEPHSERVDELAWVLAEQAGFRGKRSHFWAEAERLIASRSSCTWPTGSQHE